MSCRRAVSACGLQGLQGAPVSSIPLFGRECRGGPQQRAAAQSPHVTWNRSLAGPGKAEKLEYDGQRNEIPRYSNSACLNAGPNDSCQPLVTTFQCASQ